MKKTIFIAGIHGVGKSTFYLNLKTKLNLPHYSASKLIKIFDSSLFFVDKRVTNVEGNQDVLINSILQNVDEDIFILDGHFTLIKENNTIEDIPISTFEQLHIVKTILLLENPEVIYQRIINRDKKVILSIDEISIMQQRELQHAEFICTKLSIPLVILNNSIETDNFYKEIIT